MANSVQEIDWGWKRIKDELKQMKGSHVDVGVLSSAGKYNDPEGGGTANVADIATFNEYGTRSIPPRPFMKLSFENNREVINRFIQDHRDKIYEGQITTKQGLKLLGEFFVSRIQRVFDQSKKLFEANKPSTIAAKTRAGRKGDTPLVDTGQLRQHINYEVKIKNG